MLISLKSLVLVGAVSLAGCGGGDDAVESQFSEQQQNALALMRTLSDEEMVEGCALIQVVGAEEYFVQTPYTAILTFDEWYEITEHVCEW